jgi:hypothetical protein
MLMRMSAIRLTPGGATARAYFMQWIVRRAALLCRPQSCLNACRQGGILSTGVSRGKGKPLSDNQEADDQRPCLHCLIADLIDDFYEQYGSPSGEAETVDMGEVMSALAKVVAEMTFGSDAAFREQVLKDFAEEVSRFEMEFRESDTTGASTSGARH